MVQKNFSETPPLKISVGGFPQKGSELKSVSFYSESVSCESSMRHAPKNVYTSFHENLQSID